MTLRRFFGQQTSTDFDLLFSLIVLLKSETDRIFLTSSSTTFFVCIHVQCVSICT